MKKTIGLLIIAGVVAAPNAMAEVDITACAGCHGKDFDRQALGKSAVVKGMSADEIATKLIGYREGTFGGPMKGVMKGPVSGLSDDDIRKMAEKIANL